MFCFWEGNSPPENMVLIPEAGQNEHIPKLLDRWNG